MKNPKGYIKKLEEQNARLREQLAFAQKCTEDAEKRAESAEDNVRYLQAQLRKRTETYQYQEEKIGAFKAKKNINKYNYDEIIKDIPNIQKINKPKSSYKKELDSFVDETLGYDYFDKDVLQGYIDKMRKDLQ